MSGMTEEEAVRLALRGPPDHRVDMADANAEHRSALLRPVCWATSHVLQPNPKNAVLRFSTWRCIRCGKATGSAHGEVLDYECPAKGCEETFEALSDFREHLHETMPGTFWDPYSQPRRS